MFLLQLAGTPGAGKSTLARVLGKQTGAVVVDYDVVKSAALDVDIAWDCAGRVGYHTSRMVAQSILQQGVSVILDSPCRFQQIVDEGMRIAAEEGAAYGFIDCVLEDVDEIRRRMASRVRHRSQRVAFDVPPPDAPNDVMADPSGVIQIKPTIYPTSDWAQVDMSRPPVQCVAESLAYLEHIGIAAPRR